MKSNFVSIGECMVEMAPTAHGTYSMGFAGDTLNTAWYARKLLPESWSVSYLTSVGTDAVSDRMLAFFRDADIDTSGIARLEDKTVGLYMIQLDNGERSFAYWRSDSAAKQLAADVPGLTKKLTGAKLIYFSGITLAILSPQDRKGFLQAIADARAAGSQVAFDPNLRPRLWATNAEMCEAISVAAGCCDIVLPSYEDEAAFFGDKDPEATARRYAHQGAELVVVKNGPEDVTCLRTGEVSVHRALRVASPVDTTAAGDSFNAGFLSAYLAGESLPDAVQAGNRIASAVIGQRGALVDFIERV